MKNISTSRYLWMIGTLSFTCLLGIVACKKNQQSLDQTAILSEQNYQAREISPYTELTLEQAKTQLSNYLNLPSTPVIEEKIKGFTLGSDIVAFLASEQAEIGFRVYYGYDQNQKSLLVTQINATGQETGLIKKIPISAGPCPNWCEKTSFGPCPNWCENMGIGVGYENYYSTPGQPLTQEVIDLEQAQTFLNEFLNSSLSAVPNAKIKGLTIGADVVTFLASKNAETGFRIFMGLDQDQKVLLISEIDAQGHEFGDIFRLSTASGPCPNWCEKTVFGPCPDWCEENGIGALQ